MAATVTPADRETAERIVRFFMPPPTNFVAKAAYDATHPVAIDAIAAALAEQRERLTAARVADWKRLKKINDMWARSPRISEFCRERIAELSDYSAG